MLLVHDHHLLLLLLRSLCLEAMGVMFDLETVLPYWSSSKVQKFSPTKVEKCGCDVHCFVYEFKSAFYIKCRMCARNYPTVLLERNSFTLVSGRSSWLTIECPLQLNTPSKCRLATGQRHLLRIHFRGDRKMNGAIFFPSLKNNRNFQGKNVLEERHGIFLDH